MKSEAFKIVTTADRNHIAMIVTSTVLAYSQFACKSNRYIAVMTGNSQYGVRKVRTLMDRMGTLGMLEGTLPELPRIPETTWSRLSTAIMQANDVIEWCVEDDIFPTELASMIILNDKAIQISNDVRYDITTASDAADELDAASEAAYEAYETMRVPHTKSQINACEASPVSVVKSEARTRSVGALPSRLEMLQ